MTKVLQTEAPPATIPAVGEAPAPVRRRRPLLAVVAVLLFLMAGIVFTTALQRASAETLVWSVAVDVARGQPVARSQLEAVAVSTDAAATLLAPDSTPVDVLTDGGVWAADLAAGQLVSGSLVLDRLPVGAGRAIVGVSLEPGGLPAGAVRAGDTVLVVETDPDTEVTVLVEQASVEAVDRPADEFTTAVVVSLDVPGELAAAVAEAAAAGRVALVVVP